MFPAPKVTHARDARRGFTLVELLVVIGIIALLIGILLPTLSRARAASKNIVCQSNLRQLGTMMVMYTNDHDLFLMPYNPLFRNENAGSASYGQWHNDETFRTYFDSVVGDQADYFLCPSDTTGTHGQELKFPDSPSYGMNESSRIGVGLTLDSSNPDPYKPLITNPQFKKITRVGNATDKIIFGDAGHRALPDQRVLPQGSTSFERDSTATGYWEDGLPSFILRRVTHHDAAGLYPRHFFDDQDQANVAMLDGHVETFRDVKNYETDITSLAPGVKVKNPNVRDPDWNVGKPIEELRDLREKHWWLDPLEPIEADR